MEKWFLENGLGFSSVFLERNLRSIQSLRIPQEMPVSECSSILIQGLAPLDDTIYGNARLYIRGHQKHKNYYIPISFAERVFVEKGILLVDNPLKIRLRAFSCYDEISIYMFLSSGRVFKSYYADFSPCHLLQKREVFIKELVVGDFNHFLGFREAPSYKLVAKIFSLKDLHCNWESRVDRKTKEHLLCNFSGKNYLLGDTICIFCFKKCISEKSMLVHINSIHISYEAVFEDSESFKYHGASANQPRRILRIVEKKVTIAENGYENFFFCRKGRKGCTIQHSFPYTYFEPEVLEPLGTKRTDFPWESFFTKKKLEEIIDLSESQIKIVAEWTIFIQEKSTRPHPGNIFEYAKDFLEKYEPSFDVFMFLTCLYNNAVLSLEEVYSIVVDKVF